MGNKYIAIDCETGGIGTDKSLLTAYFGVYDEAFQLRSDLYLHVKPNDGIYKVTAEALSINKINLVEHNQEAITEKEAGTRLYDFLYNANINGKDKLIPIGHNVAFDIKFLQEHLVGQGTWEKFVSYRVLDTGVIAQFFKTAGILSEDISGGLGSLAAHYKISQSNAHTAKEDAQVTVKVLQNMISTVIFY